MGREENSDRPSARKPEVRTYGRSRHGWGIINGSSKEIDGRVGSGCTFLRKGSMLINLRVS
jgi:hypothetical protein